MLKVIKHSQVCHCGIRHPTKAIISITSLNLRRSFTSSASYNISSTSHRSDFIKSFPSLVLKFVKDESRYLAESLAKDDPTPTTEENFPNVKPEISRALNDAIDEHNRFLTLLSFNPIDIPPSLYVYFAYNYDLSNDAIRKLLVSRLAFHGLYEHIWKLLIDETSSINDIEEITILIGNMAKSNNKLELGILDAMVAMDKVVLNQSLKFVIIDCICHNFKISKSVLLDALDFQSGLEVTKFDPNFNSYRTMLFIRHCILKHSPISLYINHLQHHLLPGWVDFLLGPIDGDISAELVNELVDKTPQMLNDHDISRLSKVLEPHETFKLFKLGYYSHTTRSWSLESIMCRVIEQQDVLLVQEIFQDFHHFLGNKVLGDVLCFLKDNDNNCIEELNVLLLSDRDFSDVFQRFFRTYKLHTESLIVLHKAMLATYKSPEFYLNLRTSLPINGSSRNDIIDLYREFLQKEVRPTTVMLEIVRQVFKNKALDRLTIQRIFGALVSKLLIYSPQNVKIVNPQKMAKYHNSIRGFTQAMSNLESDDIISVSNMIVKYINGTSEFDDTKLKFRDDLCREFIITLFNFLLRVSQIGHLRYILDRLEVNSDIKDYVTFYCEVWTAPSKAVNIVKDNVNTKSALTRNVISAIEKGILKTRLLTNNEKLEVFKSFRTELARSGFKSRLNKESVIYLTDMILKMDPPSGLRERALEFAIAQKLPRYIVNRWIT